MYRDRLIVFEWPTGDGDSTTEVRVSFEPLDERSTMVRIAEGSCPTTQDGLDRSYGNCMGWTQMIAR
jgi:hypothetical protein